MADRKKYSLLMDAFEARVKNNASKSPVIGNARKEKEGTQTERMKGRKRNITGTAREIRADKEYAEDTDGVSQRDRLYDAWRKDYARQNLMKAFRKK